MTPTGIGTARLLAVDPDTLSPDAPAPRPLLLLPTVSRNAPAVAATIGANEIDVLVTYTAGAARGVARPQGAACDIGAVERRDVIFVDGFDGTTPGLD